MPEIKDITSIQSIKKEGQEFYTTSIPKKIAMEVKLDKDKHKLLWHLDEDKKITMEVINL